MSDDPAHGEERVYMNESDNLDPSPLDAELRMSLFRWLRERADPKQALIATLYVARILIHSSSDPERLLRLAVRALEG